MKEEQLITCTHAKKQPVQLLHKQENGAVSLGGEEHNGTRCRRGDMLLTYGENATKALKINDFFYLRQRKLSLHSNKNCGKIDIR